MADPAWRVISEGATGFHVFRIEKLQVVPLPREAFGKFFNGDAYIIFSCSEYGEPGGINVKPRRHNSTNLEQHIHFWIGEKASQDEVTVAAYKSVELDDLLSGTPIQHREVQGHESNRFRSYFKDGIRILEGGVASGLHHVTNDRIPKLFIVKGKRQPIIRQLVPISWSQFNDGDSFVLESGSFIFIWNGKQANRLEKLQASKLATKLKEENGDGTIVLIEDGNERAMALDELEAFEALLSLASKQVRVASAEEDDEKQDVMTRKVIKLYQCTDADGTLRIREVKTGPLAQNDLNSNDSFIIDNGSHGIWVWVGKKASQKERTEGMRNAQGFIKKKGYNASTQVTRVIDGGEPTEFKSLFREWKDKDASSGIPSFGRKISTTTVQTKFDAKVLHENPAMAAESGMVDDGRSVKEIYRVDHFDLVQVPEEDYGKFYSGDCYVILYAYNDGHRDCYIIYYWLGSHSSQDERGTAALKTVEIDDRLGGGPVQVRVVQGKEPPHFLAMFQGRLIIYQGGLASSFDGDEGRNVSVSDSYLLQVHGRTPLTTYATQVALTAASLNTNDCFVSVSPSGNWVWMGKGSTGDEREMAKRIGRMSDNDPTVVYEGQEKSDFWAQLGGKKPYVDERVLKSVGEAKTPRLFHGSNASGTFKMEEVVNFSQADLVTEDVMILDSGETLFVWLGLYSNKEETRAALVTARDYLVSDPSERNVDIPVIVVKQGFEPPHFTGFFGAWDNTLWPAPEVVIPVNNGSNHNGDGVRMMKASSISEASYANGKVYPYSLLTTTDPDAVPSDVDPSRKEAYLSDQDFQTHLGMDRECFDALPQWKQISLKKAANLF